MRQIVRISAAWLAATVVAVAIAAAAVGSVRSEVADTPTALGVEATHAVDIENPVTGAVAEPQEATTDLNEPAAEPDVTTTDAEELITVSDATVTEDDEPDNDPPRTTSTTKPHNAEDESGNSTATNTNTASQPTTASDDSYTKTYDVEGAGSVTIKVSGESVTFASAYPKDGWTFKLKDDGPEAVEVRFESNDDEGADIEFTAEIEDGKLEVSISDND